MLDDVVGALTTSRGRAAPAIENALRYREARRLADLDALTGLHNRRYFHETLEREVARAHRYGAQLALIVLDVDDFKAINEQIGHLAGDGVLAEAAERIRSVVRPADVACRVGGDEFAIILPESGLAQADQLFRRVQAAVVAPPIGQVRPLELLGRRRRADAGRRRDVVVRARGRGALPREEAPARRAPTQRSTPTPPEAVGVRARHCAAHPVAERNGR